MLLKGTLRPAGSFSICLKPAIIAPSSAVSATASFSTAATPAKIQRTQRSVFASKSLSPPALALARYASTASPATPNTPASPPTVPQTLTWNRFLTLRRTRRKISVVASSISSVAVAYGGLRVFLQAGYDATLASTLGLDPLLTTGLSTISLLATGWLIGPFFGNMAFNMWYSSIRKDIENKEREFYSRIKRHRVDPTSSSMANPVPDYYGEKIGSVADYRRWLKDQRAFNLKRGAYQGNNGSGRVCLVLGIWELDRVHESVKRVSRSVGFRRWWK